MNDGWLARIALTFRAERGQSFLAASEHEGPLYVQRPFIESGGTCQVYLLHPPGGIVGGDQLCVDVDVAGAEALLTSPGASKFYKSTGKESRLEQRIRVRQGGGFEWLPQESIVFDGARASVLTRVDVERGARFIGWETTSLGRPAAEERFTKGEFRQSFELWLDGSPLWIDRAHYHGDDPALSAPWGLDSLPINGALIAYPATEAVLDVTRARLETVVGGGAPSVESATGLIWSGEHRTAVTLVDEVLVVRYLGRSTYRARRLLVGVWEGIRELVMGKAAEAPRIWAT